MSDADAWIAPAWPLGDRVRAVTTTRSGGVSDGVYAGFNLAAHVGDAASSVAENRRRLQAVTGCRHIQWLEQVHGCAVFRAGGAPTLVPPRADAVWTRERGLGIAVLTADCLPVVIADRSGTLIAVAHAGWRGLVGGVITATLADLPVAASDCVAWLGPAIGPDAYEVGDDVAQAVDSLGECARGVLRPGKAPGKYWLDLFLLGRRQLLAAGVAEIYGEEVCTVGNPLLYSYRRDGLTGRMASLAWLPESR